MRLLPCTYMVQDLCLGSRCLCELQTSKPRALYPDGPAVDLHRGSGRPRVSSKVSWGNFGNGVTPGVLHLECCSFLER